MKLNEIAGSPTLFVPIAPSGAGKSTMLRKLQQKNPDLQVFSLDILRHKFYDPDDYAKAWQMSTEDKEFRNKANAEYMDALSQGKDLYVDNTNLTPKGRRWYIDQARRRGYKIVAITFPSVDLDTLIARQQTRGDKNVPAAAVRQQFMSLKGPEEGEFDDIIKA